VVAVLFVVVLSVAVALLVVLFVVALVVAVPLVVVGSLSLPHRRIRGALLLQRVLQPAKLAPIVSLT